MQVLRRRANLVFALSCIASMLLQSPAVAQTQGAPATPDWVPPCVVYAQAADNGQPQQLRAICRGHGFMLGPVTRFDATTNDNLQATLVDAWLENEERVILLSFQSNGQPLLEELSGQIARAAGRGPMSSLKGLAVDRSRFKTDGVLAVSPSAQDAAGEANGSVDIGLQIAMERARHGGPAAQN